MAISKITSASITDATITADDIATGAVESAMTTQIGGRRNLIINGAMQVAQRGTSQSAAGYGSLDRWLLSLSGATATLSQESFTLGQTDVVGAEYYAKVAVTTGNNNCGLYYKVEAKDVISAGGQEVTLSYWAKGTSPTNGLKVGLSIVATGGSATTDESVTLTSTWTKYTHSFTMPSFSGVTLDASSYLQIKFIQDSGDTGTAAWELNIAQVQLEVGIATPFEHRSYGEELALCQRYLQICQPGYVAGNGVSTNNIQFGYPLVTPLRAQPTIPDNGYYTHRSGNQNSSTNSINVINWTSTGTLIELRDTGHNVSDEVAYVVTVVGNMRLDAEL